MYTLCTTTGIVVNKLAYTPVTTRYVDDMIIAEIPHSADDYPAHHEGVDALFNLGYFNGYGWVYMALIGVQWEIFHIKQDGNDLILCKLQVGNDTDKIRQKVAEVINAHQTMKEMKVM